MDTRVHMFKISPRPLVNTYKLSYSPKVCTKVWPRNSEEDDDAFFKLPLEPRKPCKSFCVAVTQQHGRRAGGHPNVAVLTHGCGPSPQGEQNGGRPRRRWSLDRTTFFAVPLVLRIHDIKMKQFIAKGGFGSVYLGQFRGQTVAVKKMHRCVKNVKAKVSLFNLSVYALVFNVCFGGRVTVTK